MVSINQYSLIGGIAMPSIFLSPSVQDFNQYYDNSGSEEYYMNLVADAMEPYLDASGISFVRNNPNATLGQAIRESNAGNFDLHLALHSNAAPEYLSGQLTGPDFYYYVRSTSGMRAASTLADNYMKIYPDPSKVTIMPTSSLAEVTRTRAPSVLAELAYHDNPEDAEWIKNNIQKIAANLVQGLTIYFGIPFVEPHNNGNSGNGTVDYSNATVVTERDRLNIRRYPTMDSQVLTQAPKGSRMTVYCLTGEWYVVDYNGVLGFAYSKYVMTDKGIIF